MKKKHPKLKVIKTTQKGFPKDLRAVAVDRSAAPKDSKTAKTPTEGVFEANKARQRDPRLPAVGSVLTRKYKDADLQVKVLENGFEYKGQVFKSISALAVHIVGVSISGYVFFKLAGGKND